MPDQLGHDIARHVAGDGKADALCAADDRGVDADDLAPRGHQRAAGVPRVQRRVGLHHVVDQPAVLGAQRAAERAHHPGGDGALEAERIADGNRDLADPHAIGRAQPGPGEARGMQPQQREVGVRIVADRISLQRAAVGQDRLDLLGAMHDMAVGQHEAVRREDHAGAAALAAGLEVHDRRRHLVDGTGHRRRIGVEQVGVVGCARRRRLEAAVVVADQGEGFIHRRGSHVAGLLDWRPARAVQARRHCGAAAA